MSGLIFTGNLLNLMLIGTLIGMRHALEADHVAAIASLSSQKHSLAYTLKQGAAWGVGHTLTLLLFGSIVIFMDSAIPESLANQLEMLVGLMLVVLGADLLRRIQTNRIHMHSHQHHDGQVHYHLHAHTTETSTTEVHRHQHPDKFPLRALFIGLMHGMAGSAALILLTVDMGTSTSQSLSYILCFGVGSIVGMALLSMVISLPMKLFSRQQLWAQKLFQLFIGVMTISIGCLILVETGANSLI